MLDSLAALVDQSLVRVLEQPSGEPRLTKLETIHEYALEQLEASGEAETVRCCHANYFLVLAEKTEPEVWKETAGESGIERLQRDFDNLRAAMAWTLQPRAEPCELPCSSELLSQPGSSATSMPAMALHLAGTLAWFALAAGHIQEVRTWLAAALRQTTAPNLARAKALWGAGLLAMFLGDFPIARTELDESVELYRRSGEQPGVGGVLRELCCVAYAQGDLMAAQVYGEESVAILRAVGSEGELMLALDNLGQAFAAQGQHAAARRLFEEEYARALAVQDRVCRANAAAGLGWIAAQQGDNAAATAHLENAQELLRGSYSKLTLAAVLNLIGEVVQHQGKLERAGGSYGESLILTQEVGDKVGTTHRLHQIGTLAHAQGQDQSMRI